jgi:hypothetical protein
MSKEFYIPYFDDEYGIIAEGSKLTYLESELPLHNREIARLVDRVHMCEEELRTPGKTGRHYWQYRSMMAEALRQIEVRL